MMIVMCAVLNVVSLITKTTDPQKINTFGLRGLAVVSVCNKKCYNSPTL